MIGGINLLNAFQIYLSMADMNRYELNYIDVTKDELKTVQKVDLEIQKILEEFKTIFMKHKWDIGKTAIVKHEINTKGPPIVINPRRQPVHLLNKIDESIKEMEKHGIIEKCESPWNSPLVCVKKERKR